MAMLDMSVSVSQMRGWKPPILNIGNTFDLVEFERGIHDLSTNIVGHYEHLVSNNLIGDRIRRKRTHELNEAIRSSIIEPVLNKLVTDGEIDCMIEKLFKKDADPYTIAEEVARRFLREFN